MRRFLKNSTVYENVPHFGEKTIANSNVESLGLGCTDNHCILYDRIDCTVYLISANHNYTKSDSHMIHKNAIEATKLKEYFSTW